MTKEYLNTVNRLEPDIHMIDDGAFNASAAISLKRIADVMEKSAGDWKIEIVAGNGVPVCRCKDQWVADELAKIISHQYGNVSIRKVI